jgi:hypothetical protein
VQGILHLVKSEQNVRVFLAFPKTMASVGHLTRICKDAFSVAGAVQKTCSVCQRFGSGSNTNNLTQACDSSVFATVFTNHRFLTRFPVLAQDQEVGAEGLKKPFPKFLHPPSHYPKIWSWVRRSSALHKGHTAIQSPIQLG